ncbi:unnamed protein product [Rangifer tarandus platyrhynchus]|uniref:Uncharacterized protein n=1 Tax=Rangifer tarandus platyrhynchus TaxID=3082113 RepID=A0ABN8ZV13_RANTA|nr:unnamed protein product [Rangifer tarandus platyrhynchus]
MNSKFTFQGLSAFQPSISKYRKLHLYVFKFILLPPPICYSTHPPVDFSFQLLYFAILEFSLGVYLNLFIFNWRIIALHYCVGFCQHESAIGIIHMLPPS